MWTAAAGLLWGLCWLPWLPATLFPVVFVVVLLALGRARTGREAASIGLVYAIAAYASSGHFLLGLTRHSPFAALFFFAHLGYFAPFLASATWGAWRLERATGISRTIAFALLYVGLEGLRTRTDLSFPADVLAHALGDMPRWLSWTPWIGPHGVAVWALSVAALLERGLRVARTDRGRAAIAVACAFTLWLLPWATAPLLAPEPSEAGPLRAGIVQPHVEVTEKFDRARHPEIWDRLVALTEAVAPRVDVVVWPESSRPRAVHWDSDGPFRDPVMEDLARRVGTPILYGCEIARFRGERFEALYNGAAIAYPDGRPGDWYGKQRLLPFAEGMPFGALFGWDPIAGGKNRSGGVLTMLGKFSPGPRSTLFEVAGAKLGVLIGYEGMYPEVSARYRREGADALAILTNDLWWGRSAFPRWHANQAASVARAMQVPVLRAANAGISGAFAPDGTRITETELLAATSVVVVVPRANGAAPWAAWIGPAVPWAAFVGLAFAAIAARIRRARR